MKVDADKTQRAVLAVMLVLAMLLVVPALGRAEEGAAGHYAPGGMASFFDGFPPKPGGLAFFSFYTHYQGSAEAQVQLPVAGLTTFGLDATSNSVTLGGFYRTKLNVLGGGYAVGVAVPLIWMDAQAAVDTRFGRFAKRDSASGVGDIAIYPIMLGWTKLGGDLKYDFRFGFYAPTGTFEKDSLVNLGKNFWTFEPGIMLTYMSKKTGREASLYAAFDFNTKNKDTDYQSGSVFHIDGTLAQHLPLAGGAAGAGATGFYYQQLTADGGAGAQLPDFKGRTAGFGPVLSYFRMLGSHSLVAELKWLPELDVSNRLKGDFIWLKVAFGI